MTEYCEHCRQPVGPGLGKIPGQCPRPGHGTHHAGACCDALAPQRPGQDRPPGTFRVQADPGPQPDAPTTEEAGYSHGQWRDPVSLRQALDEFMAGQVEQRFAFQGSLEEFAALAAAAAEDEAARLTAEGIVPVSVVTGHLESAEDEARLHGLHVLAGECGADPSWRGGGDYVTFFFSGEGAGQRALAFIGRVDSFGAPWWNATKTAQPVYKAWEPPA